MNRRRYLAIAGIMAAFACYSTPVAAETSLQAAINKQADLIANGLAAVLAKDPAQLSDTDATDKAIAEELKAAGIKDGPFADRIKATTHALLTDAILTAQGIDPSGVAGKAIKAQLPTAPTIPTAGPTSTADKVVTAASSPNPGQAVTDALKNSTATDRPSPTLDGDPANAQFLKKFDTPFSSKAVLTTVQIVSAYTPIRQLSDPSNIGIQMSASLPVSAASLKDYANHELLLHDGGLFNAYFSLFPTAPRYWKKDWGDRRLAVNRFYFAPAYARWKIRQDSDAIVKDKDDATRLAKDKQDLTDDLKLLDDIQTAKQAYIYLSHGIGMKAVKTSLEEGNLSLAGLGTAYVGLGIDGPVFDSAKVDSDPSSESAGSLSLEVFAAGNVTSKRALRSLYTTSMPSFDFNRAYFFTWGAQARFYIADKVFLSAGYYRPLDRYGRDLIHEVATFSIGYNAGTSSTSTSSTKGSP